MEKNRRFTVFAFPQYFDGNNLSLNIVVLPRNQNPLQGAIIKHTAAPYIPPIIPDAPAFADAALAFEAKIITGLGSFPNNQLPDASKALATSTPAHARDLFSAMAKNFSIDPAALTQTNEDLSTNNDKANTGVTQALSVKKYLPVSYRQAFNFTTPRTKNALTDDSYQSAVRDAGKVPGFTRSSDAISWGKVFAYALRQPLLAAQLGMVYQTQMPVEAADFPLGGWLYVDLAAASDYKAQQAADDTFIKKYAARIPALKAGQARQVFAPLLFPVLYKANPGDPDPAPDGDYDQIFLETADYDDGFAKIVHAYQPHSINLLSEESDGAHPVKDMGVRLGWDDEQILIWYMRQMSIDPSVSDPDGRLDAPLGTFGYAVDVRDGSNPALPWESLNQVIAKQDLTIADPPGGPLKVAKSGVKLELPYQVYPAQLDGDLTKNYWLPMYFASWNGLSMVLPDQQASDIYQTNNPNVKPDPLSSGTGTGVTGPAQNQLNQLYNPGKIKTKLLYGQKYEFRIRLQDLSGGGPALSPTVNPINDTPSNVARSNFKRYVPPNQVRIKNLPVNSDSVTTINALNVQRPLLGYPAAVYTGKYADAVSLLKAASVAMQGTEAFGISDPDVDRVEVTVEVQTLRMDNLLSVSGTENYVHLYTTTRAFPAVNNEGDYDDALNIPILYRECHVLHVGDELDLKTDLNLPDDIDKLAEIYVPSGRTIRLTLRAVSEEKASNSEYYGLLNDANHDMDVRFGHIVQTRVYKPSSKEKDLFVKASPAEQLQGIYLQPDPPEVYNGKLMTLLIGQTADQMPDMLQRLAKQIGVASVDMTLTANEGQRLQFGCSARIRHTLSPENSSLTFSSKGDLGNHWLVCILLDLDRDWTWDALDDRSFVITRKTWFTHDNPATEAVTAEVGTVEFRHTASFEAMQNPQRDSSRLVFIDAVEPKNPLMQTADPSQPRFPDTIEVQYTITPVFKAGYGAQNDGPLGLAMTLPITTPPAQVPQITSAGIALSPYARNAKYSATQTRQRYLWVEFKDPVQDPDDGYFCRVLAYTPDQLISNNEPDLLIAQTEPSLPIDPEFIRVIPPGATNDLSGLNAMQAMQKATDSDRHYLMPLPPGLYSDAPEMFGFFTYEFRLGHYRNRDTQEMVWTTAQGRFGRQLRATGIQHPAPALTCAVNRDPDKLTVSAPYAVAVFNGKNVTADPPRTELWALLYAQVKQADALDFRNILLDDKKLDWRIQLETDPAVNWFERYTDPERQLLKTITVNTWKDDLSYSKFQHLFKLADFSNVSKDATRYGLTAWTADEIDQLLARYGLPPDSPLSVLVVEILPTITNIFEQVPGLGQARVRDALRQKLQVSGLPEDGVIKETLARQSRTRDFEREPDPLSEELGQHRILRTSPLTEAPFVC